MAGAGKLRAALSCPVHLPGDAGFDTGCNAFHISPLKLPEDNLPAAVVQPTCAEDVQAAVAFCVSHRLPLAVKGGGHSPR